MRPISVREIFMTLTPAPALLEAMHCPLQEDEGPSHELQEQDNALRGPDSGPEAEGCAHEQESHADVDEEVSASEPEAEECADKPEHNADVHEHEPEDEEPDDILEAWAEVEKEATPAKAEPTILLDFVDAGGLKRRLLSDGRKLVLGKTVAKRLLAPCSLHKS